MADLKNDPARVTRMVEEFDPVRDRASVVADQLADQRADAMIRKMLILSLAAAAIFSPLGFITGFPEITFGGMTGAIAAAAFWIAALFCGILGAGLMMYFHRKGWL